MTDTIAAISTPYGKGGIAVLRISGEEAIAIAERIFFPASGRALTQYPPAHMTYGTVRNPDLTGVPGKLIDDGMAVYFRAPHSYTGEDTVEISCHGGILLTEQVLTAILSAGARPAEAGEFTRRAFVAGKLSLTEAEAVINLIDARSEEALRLARSHTEGRLTAKLAEFYEELRTLLSTAYVFADYPDEDLTDLSAEEMQARLTALAEEMRILADSYRIGHAIGEGISAVLVGRPNTGKSSLLNRLLGRDRAIVSNIAGTTRDTIEETVQMGKVTLRLTDTAGLRESDDPIEQIGVRRSVAALESAELILAVFDLADGLTDEDRELITRLEGCSAPCIALLNKSDRALGTWDAAALGGPFCAVCTVSAETGEGLEALRNQIESLFVAGEIDYDTTPILANARQKGALDRARVGVEDARRALAAGFTPDVAGLDLEEAMAALSEADGRSVSADIVDAIFHRFCVGK